MKLVNGYFPKDTVIGWLNCVGDPPAKSNRSKIACNDVAAYPTRWRLHLISLISSNKMG